MVKLRFGAHWMDGSADYFCDQCGRVRSIPLAVYVDEGAPAGDLRDEGWVFVNCGGNWLDFCCRECRRRYFTGRDGGGGREEPE